MRIPALVAAVLLLPSAAWAGTLKVPSEDTPTIQSAVDAAAEGDTILIAEGLYPEAVSIVGRAGLTLRGRGDATVLLPPGPGLAIDIQGSSGITVTGLAVTGTGADCVHVYDSSEVLLSKLTASAGDAIIRLQGTSFVTISRCRIGESVRGVVDDSSTDLVIDKCTFAATSAEAVYLSPYNSSGTGSDRARVSKSNFESVNTGIHCGGDEIVLEKNRIEATGTAGIIVNGSSNPQGVVVAKNLVAGGGTGISAGMGNSTLSKNSCGGATSAAIQVSGAGNRIEKNRAEGGVFGIQASGDDNTLSKNLVAESDVGIEVSGAGGIVLEKNGVANAGVTGIRVYAPGCQIISNRVINAGSHGIHVTTSGNTLSRNSASGSGSYDLASQVDEASNTYDRNRFETTVFNYD